MQAERIYSKRRLRSWITRKPECGASTSRSDVGNRRTSSRCFPREAKQILPASSPSLVVHHPLCDGSASDDWTPQNIARHVLSELLYAFCERAEV